MPRQQSLNIVALRGSGAYRSPGAFDAAHAAVRLVAHEDTGGLRDAVRDRAAAHRRGYRDARRTGAVDPRGRGVLTATRFSSRAGADRRIFMSTHGDKRTRAATRDIPEDEKDGVAAAAVADEEPDGTATGGATDFSTSINPMAGAWSVGVSDTRQQRERRRRLLPCGQSLPVGILATKFFGLATPNRTRWL
ncbi:hypothetical protein JB92DRAFT_3142947 [Gautieria morchelliformis]|nr:hypothetical protein JB92DRAFT_3142947 [Gautieria morchelliformis]